MDTSPINKVKTRQNTENAHKFNCFIIYHIFLIFTEVEDVLQKTGVGEHAALHVLEGVLDEAEGPLLLADAHRDLGRLGLDHFFHFQESHEVED